MPHVNSFISHLQFNVDAATRPFYRDLFALLDWTVVHEDQAVIGFKSGERPGSVWFVTTPGKATTDYDQRGLNHLGIGVEEQRNVDEVTEFLRQRDVPALFGTPRHRKEFAEDARGTYYQVMFESPDGILLEVVYIGPLQT